MPPARAAVTDMTMTMAWGPMASARNIMVSAQPRANMRAAGFPRAAAGLAGVVAEAAAVCLIRATATITRGGTARDERWTTSVKLIAVSAQDLVQAVLTGGGTNPQH